jgi:hypothetical protein
MATRAATITMTMREADRLKMIQAVVDRMLRVGQAAQRLGLSPRQVERLVDAAPRARGCDHPHAIRILARTWLRVIWRAWVLCNRSIRHQ